MNRVNLSAKDLIANYPEALSMGLGTQESLAVLKDGVFDLAKSYLIENQEIVDAIRAGNLPTGTSPDKRLYLDVLLVVQAIFRNQKQVDLESADFSDAKVDASHSVLDSDMQLKNKILPLLNEFSVKTHSRPLVCRVLKNSNLVETSRNSMTRLKTGTKVLLDFIHEPTVCKVFEGSSAHLFVRLRSINSKNVSKKGYYVSLDFLESSVDVINFDAKIKSLSSQVVSTKPDVENVKPSTEVEVQESLPEFTTVTEDQKASPLEIKQAYENNYIFLNKMILDLLPKLEAAFFDSTAAKQTYIQLTADLRTKFLEIYDSSDLSEQEKFENALSLRGQVLYLYDFPVASSQIKRFGRALKAQIEAQKKFNKCREALRYLDLILSAKIPSEIVESRFAQSDTKPFLRDIALMNSFELNFINDGAILLNAQLSPLALIIKKANAGISLNAQEKEQVLNSAKYLHTNKLLNLIVSRSGSFLDRLEYLRPYLSPQAQELIDKQIKLIEGIVKVYHTLRYFIKAYEEGSDFESLLNEIIPMFASLLLTAAAVAAAPVTSGASLATLSTFLIGVASGVAGNELGNVIGDSFGKSMYGPLYRSHANINQFIDGDINASELFVNYGQDFVVSLFSDLVTMGAIKVCRSGMSKFAMSLKSDNPTIRAFKSHFQDISSSPNLPLSHREAQYVAKFLNEVESGAKGLILNRSASLLYTYVLTGIKESALSNAFGFRVYRSNIFRNMPRHLRVEYNVHFSKRTELIEKIKEMYASNAEISQTHNQIKVTYKDENQNQFEIIFNLGLDNQFAERELKELNAPYNRQVYAIDNVLLPELPNELQQNDIQKVQEGAVDVTPYLVHVMHKVALDEQKRYIQPTFTFKDHSGAHLFLNDLLTLRGFQLEDAPKTNTKLGFKQVAIKDENLIKFNIVKVSNSNIYKLLI